MSNLLSNQYLEVIGKCYSITIESRPSYCDRGNYLAKVFSNPQMLLDKDHHFIDDADGWPRYYFDLDIAKLEVEAWLKKRNQLESNILWVKKTI